MNDMNNKAAIIDDEIDICFLLARILRQNDRQVSYAHSLHDGSTLLHDETPSLLFLDVNLPDGSGMEFLPRIREMYPQTKIIMISAFDSTKERQAAISNGADAFVGKPFTRQEINTIIHQVGG
jgi:DNA-binding response OmpR family regulator